MSDADEARLDIARRAWLVWNSSDENVEAGVQRVARRLRMKPRSTASRRALTVASVSFALFTALAYAQTGGFEHPPTFGARWFGGAAPTEPLEHGVYPDALADRVSRLEQRGLALAPVPVPPASKPLDPSELPAEAPELEPAQPPRAPVAAAERPRRAPRASVARSVPKPGGTWREIDEALAADDEATARRLLQGLASGEEDATTQAKARLGLAQLSLSRGDCKRATKIAERVARSEGIEEKLVRRAHDIVLRCQ